MAIRVYIDQLIFLYLMANGMPDADKIYIVWQKDNVLREYPRPKRAKLEDIVDNERRLIEKQIYGATN